MQISRDRILTTHVGSLPRSESLSDLLIRTEAGETVDRARLAVEAASAVRHVVAAQIEAGLDVVNDGEQPRVGFQTYVAERMSGFGGESQRPRPRDIAEFPALGRQLAARFPRRSRVSNAPQAVAAVRYGTLDAAREECRMLRDALAAAPRRPAEAFLTAPSPGIIATTFLNAHYASHRDYVFALAREIGQEYRTIVEEGFLLQVDAPDLAMERTMLFQHLETTAFLEIAELHVAALAAALDGIPRDRVRLHCCWGNWEGPHIHDIPLAEVLPLLYRAPVGAISLEFANPRHQHEYAAVAASPPPPEILLLPGVIDSTTNYVEHPEVVANRICEAVAAVGDRERVIAGCDCGFGTFAGNEYVAEDVVWAKLRSLADGASIASQRLWGRAAA